LRLYFSLGHMQVMTDVMAPFAQSVLKHFAPVFRAANGESRILRSAGDRLYIDISDLVRVRPPAWVAVRVFSEVDQRSALAIGEVMSRPEFKRTPSQLPWWARLKFSAFIFGRVVPRIFWRLFFADPTQSVPSARRWMDEHYEEASAKVSAGSTPLARLSEAINQLSNLLVELVPKLVSSMMTAFVAQALLHLFVSKRATRQDLDALGRGLEGNITTDMNLQIGDLADTVRETPAVADRLRESSNVDLGDLRAEPTAERFNQSLATFFDTYGMRGASEIDVTRPRWRDDPRPLLEVIRGGLTRSESGEHRHHHDALQHQGEAAAKRVVATAAWGTRLVVGRLVSVARHLFAIREHPKFQIVRYIGLVRVAALEVGAELVSRGVIERAEDVWMLSYSEILEVAAGGVDALPEISLRRAQMARHALLKPPRVLTSEGERVAAKLSSEDLPLGALPGTGASAGMVEGIARVVHDPASAELEVGEILVAAFTDPGWTPLFINAAGLVMEVGGMMTHGSVVAREYGIPAVVCVDEATARIETGQRLRVDGDGGYVLILADEGEDGEVSRGV
jgi:pyruvate,water dikinase